MLQWQLLAHGFFRCDAQKSVAIGGTTDAHGVAHVMGGSPSKGARQTELNNNELIWQFILDSDSAITFRAP
jgi:hypothetical protein